MNCLRVLSKLPEDRSEHLSLIEGQSDPFSFALGLGGSLLRT